MNTGFLITVRQTAVGTAVLLSVAASTLSASVVRAADGLPSPVLEEGTAPATEESSGGVTPSSEVLEPVTGTAPAAQEPVAEPALAPQATPEEEIPTAIKPMSATMRSDTMAPLESVSAPDDMPIDESAENMVPQEAGAIAVIQDTATAAETSADYIPLLPALALSFLTGALVMFGLMRGTQKTASAKKIDPSHRCRYCQGTGEVSNENKETGACDECDGTGTVEEESEPATECPHCHGEGEDPCHDCEGAGKDESGAECAACHGGGKTLDGEVEPGEEPEVADCEVCDGEGEVAATIKKTATCAKCGGTGRV